jgi:tripartite-type tricarboxylate transporter receptor subunit TctC
MVLRRDRGRALGECVVRREGRCRHFALLGLEPKGSSPEQLAQRIRDDAAKWSRMLKASGATEE